MSGIRVDPVQTADDLRAFIDLPLRLHPRTHYVPLWHSTIRRWQAGDGPHRAHGDVRLLLARDAAGTVVGRSTVHTDTRMDTRLGRPAQLMGATEFTGSQALGALAGFAEGMARESGRRVLLGPVSLLPNQIGGVITSGHDQRGFVDSAWNPASYPAAWEAQGFTRTWQAHTWICDDFAGLHPAATFRGPATGSDGLRLHRGSRRRLGAQLEVVRQMLNASFAELPYYTPIEADELAVQTEGLAWVLDESLLLWVTRHDAPLAFVLVVPDLTGFVTATGGRLGLVEQVRLVLTRRRYRRDAVLIVKGTVPGARGQGLMSLLSRELLANLQAGGYRALRVTFIGEDNAGSRAQFEVMGGRPLHGLTFYRKELG